MEIEQHIASARKGDTAAYGHVVEEFQAPLRAFLAAYCPDRDQINEIAQKAFVWAYEHLQEYEPGTRFQAWLKSIARNHLLAELEVQKREAEGKRKYLQHIQILHSRSSLEAAGGTEAPDLAAALRRCIDDLPDHARSLIRSRYEGERSVESIARELGRKSGAVKVTLFRIRQALRRCMEGKSEPLGSLT